MLPPPRHAHAGTNPSTTDHPEIRWMPASRPNPPAEPHHPCGSSGHSANLPSPGNRPQTWNSSDRSIRSWRDGFHCSRTAETRRSRTSPAVEFTQHPVAVKPRLSPAHSRTMTAPSLCVPAAQQKKCCDEADLQPITRFRCISGTQSAAKVLAGELPPIAGPRTPCLPACIAHNQTDPPAWNSRP